jgi:hypothetical protein
MLGSLKEVLKKTIPYNVIKSRRDRRALRTWEKEGRPVPPPHIIKEKVIKEYASEFRVRVMIETGTYLGDMVYAMRDRFDKLISFELDPTLHRDAKNRFAKYEHISIVQGDSGKLLGDYLASIAQPCLFWLDGHYSGGVTARASLDTPIMSELEYILAHRTDGHVILVDDARCFTGENDYPTISELEALVSQKKPDWHFSVETDIIRIHR